MKFLIFMFFVILFSIMKAVANVGKGTIEIAKNAYETVYDKPISNSFSNKNIDIYVIIMLETIEKNFEIAHCLQPIRNSKEYYLLLLEVVIFYRILAFILLSIFASINNPQDVLKKFSSLVDTRIIEFLTRYNEHAKDDYLKYYEIKRNTYTEETMKILKESNYPNPSINIFNKLTSILTLYATFHCYLIQKNNKIIEDDYVFKNSQKLAKETYQLVTKRTTNYSTRTLEILQSMRTLVAEFLKSY